MNAERFADRSHAGLRGGRTDFEGGGTANIEDSNSINHPIGQWSGDRRGGADLPCSVEFDDEGRLAKVKIVDPSFHHWPAPPVPLVDIAHKRFNLSHAGDAL